MNTVLLKNGENISETLLSIIYKATFEDVKYQEKLMVCHYELKDIKIGYSPISIKGVDIPSFLIVTFVKGKDKSGNYFYVVNTAMETEYEVADEKEAKLSVLLEMKRILRKQGGINRV